MAHHHGGREIARIKLMEKYPELIAVDPNKNLVYVSYLSSDIVSVINGSSNEKLADIPIGYARDITVNPATHKVYVANIVNDSILVIDAESQNKIVAKIPVLRPLAIAVNEIRN